MPNKKNDELREINNYWYEQYRFQLDLIFSQGAVGGNHAKLKDNLDQAILGLLKNYRSVDSIKEAVGKQESWANPYAEGQVIQQNSKNDLRKSILERLDIK